MDLQNQIKRLFGPRMDGVIEAVHYQDGKLAWVRAYERRGPTWSDWVLLDRQILVERIQAGRRFVSGDRVEFEASNFETGRRILLVEKGRNAYLVTENISNPDRDQLDGVPLV
jgi:hypothetical protein